ncbi:hypothetical protein ON010_g4582 [Phytophthora cinnamomi]|nr:hypothetical protein ON010_g4582 [Phytophthora cinnamomi]
MSRSLGRAWRKESGLASRSTAVGKVDWNFDTSVETSPEADDSDEVGGRASTEKLAQSSRTTSRHRGPGISIERTVPAKQPSYFASKFKKNQVQALQEENAALTSENAKLREEIEQLETLNAVLQNDKPNNSQLDDHEDSMEFAQRRMRLLQAQNLQLRRQVSLLQDAMQAQANAETNLLSALNQWRGVIDAGRKEAKAAGADENAAEAPAKPEQTGVQRQPIKWMLAIPEKLMDELNRVEGQIRGAANAANACYETKLRVSKLSASFLRDNDTTVKLSEIYGREPSSLAHLRIDRVKQLEEALAIVAGELVQLSAQVLERLAPTVSTTDPVRSHAYELSRSVRELLLEVGAFGAVVCTPSATVPSSRGTTATIDAECITAVDIYSYGQQRGGLPQRSGVLADGVANSRRLDQTVGQACPSPWPDEGGVVPALPVGSDDQLGRSVRVFPAVLRREQHATESIPAAAGGDTQYGAPDAAGRAAPVARVHKQRPTEDG